MRNIEDELSVGKMHIPFRRIVGLIAVGLLTGALFRLIHQALQKMKGKTTSLTGGVLATFEVEGERFQAWTTNPQSIQDLHELRRST
jgi:hypothetical protein